MRNIYPLHGDAIRLLLGAAICQNIFGQVFFRHRQHCHRDRLVETPRSATAWIEIESTIYIILGIPVAVTIDHHIRIHIRGNILFLMGYEELSAVKFYLQGIWYVRRPVAVIVATDDVIVSGQTSNLLQRIRSAYISAVKDQFTTLDNICHLRPQQIVGIRDHCDPVTGLMFISQLDALLTYLGLNDLRGHLFPTAPAAPSRLHGELPTAYA